MVVDRCPSCTHAKVEAMTLIMTSRCVNWGSVALLTNTQGKTCWLRICFWKPEAYEWGVWNCLSWLLQAQNGCWNSCLVAPFGTSGLKWQSQLPAKLVPQHLLQMFNQSQLGAEAGLFMVVYCARHSIENPFHTRFQETTSLNHLAIGWKESNVLSQQKAFSAQSICKLPFQHPPGRSMRIFMKWQENSLSSKPRIKVWPREQMCHDWNRLKSSQKNPGIDLKPTCAMSVPHWNVKVIQNVSTSGKKPLFLPININHSFYQIHPSLISCFFKKWHVLKNSEAKNCIGPEKPRVVVSANAVGWKWATVRATWPTHRNKREKKMSDKAKMAGGVLMSQKGVGELVKTCRYKCDTMVKLVVCCTLLCWGLLSNTDSCCELSLGSQFFPKGCV